MLHKSPPTLCAWCTRARNHSVGTTTATAASSRPSATCYATNVRSPAWPTNPPATSAARNSRARRHATGTWRTRSASNDATHSRLASQLLNTSAAGAAKLNYHLRVHILRKATRLNWTVPRVGGWAVMDVGNRARLALQPALRVYG